MQFYLEVLVILAFQWFSNSIVQLPHLPSFLSLFGQSQTHYSLRDWKKKAKRKEKCIGTVTSCGRNDWFTLQGKPEEAQSSSLWVTSPESTLSVHSRTFETPFSTCEWLRERLTRFYHRVRFGFGFGYWYHWYLLEIPDRVFPYFVLAYLARHQIWDIILSVYHAFSIKAKQLPQTMAKKSV